MSFAVVGTVAGAWLGAGTAVGVAGGALIGGAIGGKLGEGMSTGRAGPGASSAENLLANISAEEWDLYKKEAVPMLRELAGMRGPTTVEEEQALAAGETKAAFSTARQNLERQIGRTRNPGEQGFAALLAPTYLDEAGAVSRALTDARTRVSDRDWARSLQAIQSYQRLPQDASAAAAQSGQLGLGRERTALISRQLRGQEASEAAYGGVAIANAARRWMNQRDTTTTPSESTYLSQSPYVPSSYDSYPAGYMGQEVFEHGGKIRGAGSGTSDSVPALVDGRKPIRVSTGEYVIPADVVRTKGQEFFDKLLQKYHRPAPERGGMADGGVIRRRGLPADVEDAIFVSLPREALSTRRGR